MLNKPLVFVINIKGAAQIFLNNEKIIDIGKFPKRKAKAKLEFYEELTPHAFMFKKVGEQTLAIRFIFTHTTSLYDRLDIFPISLRINKLENYYSYKIKSFDTNYGLSGIAAGAFLVMALIHFFFLSFFRSKRYNLSFGVSMFLFTLYFYLNTVAIYSTGRGSFLSNAIIREIAYPLAHIVLLSAVYDYLKYPKRLLFAFVFLAFFIGKLLVFFELIDIYSVAFYGLLLVNYAYLLWYALKQKNPEAKTLKNAIIVFLATAVVYVVLFIVVVSVLVSIDFTLVDDGVAKFMLPLLFNIFIVGPQLVVSGAISLSLAKEFVKNNAILAKQLAEIEQLSAEKEDLLTRQNEMLERQVAERTDELQNSLKELHATQEQLIQSEKLASLGELTAGIAHEIQNPLNFVNNFSELSVELIEEAPKPPKGANEDWIPQEIPYGGWGAFFDDLKLNLQKINHHGKRASSIVSGMLQHSRASTGVKELTDINKLADEYLRLSYHGLRAKDSSFNADYELTSAPQLPQIKIVPQDMGRVLLNLINNAFYAVSKRNAISTIPDAKKYKPTVKVSVQQIDNQVQITIADNGTGISKENLAKIFQPFFTTKPTGEGTGLGLSLAYDIVTKGHGGTIEVESAEGEGTTFILKLPIS
ncbi:MAG: GHKL domain-containing protein [Cytophagia bacterium]|nr:MAG: GHKL domain-containing protein [Runella sp.]TAG19800.1 MAG: GHKL domain-containing protein [Cytophagales bacterium]TAG39430.1 MAG: GHKL domain-containing protein [Cytophagia bacterium]TAG80616.1 MAG: GHKL domain-containing protein [Cytophagales bacterium]